MSDTRWERWASGSGVAFVVLFVAGLLLASDLPKAGDSNDAILGWFQDRETELGWQAALFGLAGIAFVWFVGTLAAAIRRAESDPAGRLPAIVVVAGATTAGIYTVAEAVLVAGSNAAGAIDAATARALYETGTTAAVLSTFPAIAFVAAVSIAVVRTGLLPRWLSYAGGIFVAISLIDVGGRLIDGNEAFGPGGWYGLVALIAFLVWTLAASTLLLQRISAQAPAPRMAPTG